MKVQVTVNNVKIIEPSILNENEYNIHECEFEFVEEYNGLSKKAVFTNEANETYVETIVDNICSIPSEVLKDKENVKLGVYAYDVDNEELLLRYSPRPTEFYVHEGSYKEGQNSTPPTPSEIEQLQSQITTNANDIEELQECCGRYDSDIAEIKAEQITQNTSIHNNADNIETINEQISDINEAITDLEINKANVTDLNALTERVSTNERDIDTIEGQISDINQNIDNLEQELTNYSLITETGSQINLNINSTNYQIKAILKDKNGNVIYTSNAIDLPIESMIVNARYDNTTKEIVLTLQNGNTLRISVADLVSGLVSETQLQTILANYYTKTEVDSLLSNLAERVSTNEEDISDIKAEQITQNANIEELQSQVETLQEDLESANSEIEELNTDIINMRKAMLQVEGEGTDITLQNTSENKFVEFGLSGRTEQEQLTGKNLADPNFSNYIKTGGNYGYKKLIEDFTKTYLVVSIVDKKPTTPLSAGIYFGFTGNGIDFTEGGNWIIANSKISNTDKYTRTYKYLSFYPKTESVFNEIFDKYEIQIELSDSTTATSYEPYCGGIPSPNPGYPQQIKNVTGNSNVKIQNKNLFDESIFKQYDTKEDDEAYKMYNSQVYNKDLTPNISFKENTSYTLIYVAKQSSGNPRLAINYDDGTIAECPNTAMSINYTQYMLATPSNKKIKNISLRYGSTGYVYIKKNSVMVLEGAYTSETITSYVPHQEQNLPFTFAEGQRGMQGTQLLDDGIHNIRVHVIVNGTENWQVYSNKEHCFKLQLKYTSASGLCTHYQNIGATYLDIKNGIYLTFTNAIIISDLRFSSVEDFKSWLVQQYNNGTPLEVEYVIRGNEEKIPYNSTQQAQYNAIKQARSYDDITYITSTSDELGFNINVESLANANKVIDSLDTRLSALEGNTNQTRSLEVDTKNITKETTDAESEVK